MVDLSMTPEQAAQAHPSDSEILDGEKGDKYLIEKRVLVSGADLVDAQPGSISVPMSRSSVSVSIRRARANSPKPPSQCRQAVRHRARHKVISAPVIRDAILGGSGQISGSFTVQSANDLAICCAPARYRRR